MNRPTFKELKKDRWWARLIWVIVIAVYIAGALTTIALSLNDYVLHQTEKIYRKDSEFSKLEGPVVYQNEPNIIWLEDTKSKPSEPLPGKDFQLSPQDYKTRIFNDWSNLPKVILILLAITIVYWLVLWIIYKLAMYIAYGKENK